MYIIVGVLCYLNFNFDIKIIPMKGTPSTLVVLTTDLNISNVTLLLTFLISLTFYKPLFFGTCLIIL